MKKITLLLVGSLFSLLGYAQQEINTDFANQMEARFAGLNKASVPTGILLDYGMEFIDVTKYNGVLSDSIYSDYNQVQQLYNTLLMSRVTANAAAGFVSPNDYDSRWQTARAKGTIAIGGLFFKYNSFADNALTDGKLALINNVLYDQYNNGVWLNPYQEKKVFAMTPAVQSIDGFNLNIKIPSSIFYTNNQSLVQSIQVDFDNGQGYIAMPFDQAIAVNYTTEGFKIWKYKLTMTNGAELYNQSSVTINLLPKTVPYGTGIDPNFVPEPVCTLPDCRDYYAKSSQAKRDPVYEDGVLRSRDITATKEYLGKKATVNIKIQIAANHNNEIRNPLIVAEGFDIGTFLTPEKPNGEYDYKSFRDYLAKSGDNLLSLLSYNYRQYDIIYIDWDNGVDYMQRNAYALEEVIKWVNTVKKGGNKNVVLGQSMGGVIARYALADMEQFGLDHDTRLFVSHDAPQQGANIPISLQYMSRQLKSQFVKASNTLNTVNLLVPLINIKVLGTPISTKELKESMNLSDDINSLSIADLPASKQLLKNYVKPDYTIDNTAHESFFNELKYKGIGSQSGPPSGYPTKCRNVAMSNGSEDGSIQDFQPNADLVNLNYNKGLTFGGDLLSLAYLPLAGFLGSTTNGLDPKLASVGILGAIPGNSKFSLEFNAKAMPYGTGNQIYKGRIAYTKKVLWLLGNVTTVLTNKQLNQPANVLPFDSYGGGYFDTKAISGKLDIQGLFVRNHFSFIPTSSALDIGKRAVTLTDSDYLFSYKGAAPPVAPKNSPFANFITDYDVNPSQQNHQHISFNTRNGDWLALELGETPAIPTDCVSVLKTNVISGSDTICGDAGSVYSIPNTVDYYSWNITEGANLVTIKSTEYGSIRNSVIIAPKYTSLSGFVTIQLVYGNSICGYKTLTKRISINGGSSPIATKTTSQDSYFYAERCDDLYHYFGINVVNQGETSLIGTGTINFYNPNAGIIETSMVGTYHVFKILRSKLASMGSYPTFTYSLTVNSGCNTKVINGLAVTLFVCPNSSTYKIAAAKSTKESNIENVTNTETNLENADTEILVQSLKNDIEDITIENRSKSIKTLNYSIYPVPTSNLLNVEINKKDGVFGKDFKMAVILFDLNGALKRRVLSSDGSTATLAVYDLPKGVYLLQVEINGKIKTHQVLVE